MPTPRILSVSAANAQTLPLKLAGTPPFSKSFLIFLLLATVAGGSDPVMMASHFCSSCPRKAAAEAVEYEGVEGGDVEDVPEGERMKPHSSVGRVNRATVVAVAVAVEEGPDGVWSARVWVCADVCEESRCEPDETEEMEMDRSGVEG